MKFVLAIYAAGLLLELGMQGVVQLWPVRKLLAGACVVLTAFASGALVILKPNVFSVVIAIISLYRVFNYIRIAQGRMHERYLHHATRRTGMVLVVTQIIVALYWLAWHAYEPITSIVWMFVAGGQLTVAIVLLASTVRRLERTRWPLKTAHLSNDDLPTITVAIPARNETEDLQACLDSLVACDYPKLEILVLDDCSQTKRTPEIIRGYAHDGVRFIKGSEPSETWLPKNQAYDRLASEASGSYIVFCGVDIRFGQTSLRQLVELLTSKNKQMMSILPYRSDSV
ncbi:MAG TPA: glycosyltransferase, partial [Candidatus Saccharimonadales bacterium]|nr:glycosyltransferase [Candidatus Saccharimonadales bacterium]